MFSPLPPALATALRDHDIGLRRELRVLGSVLALGGFGVAAFITQYVVRMERLLAPRQDEWLPWLVALSVFGLGLYLRRLARTAGLMKRLVARLAEVKVVRLETQRRRYAVGLNLAFLFDGDEKELLPLGDGLSASDPRVQQVLADARSVCPGLRSR
ncbi:MAG: hypothetical protein JNM69_17335 [Archangium sp.]|nr:hypothetical protein [Archangium sp.]